MSDTSDFLTKFGEKHFTALFLLDEYDYLFFHDFRVLLGTGYEQTLLILKDLTDSGLVETIKVGRKRRIKLYKLTDKGKKLVSMLKSFK